jgi:hypothetical protein
MRFLSEAGFIPFGLTGVSPSNPVSILQGVEKTLNIQAGSGIIQEIPV